MSSKMFGKGGGGGGSRVSRGLRAIGRAVRGGINRLRGRGPRGGRR